MSKFQRSLELYLKPHYAPPNIFGGHDYTHVQRMVRLGSQIRDRLNIDFAMDEFVTAVWLHNLDRASSLKHDIQKAGGLSNYCLLLLATSSFNIHQRERILDAVMQHSKKDDDPSDSALLTALRVADKLDRIGPLGILASAADRGGLLLPYNDKKPFQVESTAEKNLQTIYNDLIRVLEWYGMLPSDKARSLVNKRRLKFYIEFLRMLGEEVSEVTNKENRVEEDVQKALGPYYHKVLGLESSPEIIDELSTR